MMMNFTLSNQVQIPAVGIGTFMMTPDQAEQAVVDALACRIPHDRHGTGLHE